MSRSMDCGVCGKTVGWAESVARDGSVFHRGCFKCAGCKKRLDRGAGLRDQGQYFCRNCHSKNFGPMGFNKGVVVKTEAVMTRVTTNVQPVFAHVSTKPVAEAKQANDKLYEFDVALFEGDSIEDLKNYLTEGNVDTSSWTEQTFQDLLDHTKTGKCELGLGPDGNALRVASVAKVFVYDSANDLLLFNPLCSKEDESFVEARRKAMKTDTTNLQKVVGAAKGDLKADGNMYAAVAALMDLRKRPNQEASSSQNVRIPGDLVFQTTFSTFKETARDAGARVFAWRFNLEDVTGRIFEKVVPRKVTVQESVHYPGLKSEYHTHHLMLKPEFVVPLQKSLPVGEVTPVGLDEITNSGINVHWYVWLVKSNDGKKMAAQLGDLYEASEKVKSLVGEIDQEKAYAFGMLLEEEASLMNQWN